MNILNNELLSDGMCRLYLENKDGTKQCFKCDMVCISDEYVESHIEGDAILISPIATTKLYKENGKEINIVKRKKKMNNLIEI